MNDDNKNTLGYRSGEDTFSPRVWVSIIKRGQMYVPDGYALEVDTGPDMLRLVIDMKRLK